MNPPSAILAQLSALKLSNGARVGDPILRTVNTPTDVASSLNALIKGPWQFDVTPLQEGTLKKAGRDNNRRDGDDSLAFTAVGGSNAATVTTTLTTTTDTSIAATSSATNYDEPKLLKNNSGGSGGVRPSRLLRPTPRSQQNPEESHDNDLGKTTPSTVTPPAPASSTLEQLLRALPSTTIATVREASPALPPVTIALSNDGPEALRLVTVVSGDAANPQLLTPIDNFNAQKPIIRIASPCEHRYIIVGDVHGCPEQLEELMFQVNYQKDKDVLILAGDLVNKGPDSIGSVRLAQKLGAIGVLGNHDRTLLSCIARCRKAKLTPQDEMDPVMQLASVFPKECEDYLRSLPHVLRIPKYNVLVVHAGLNPSYSVENQDVFEIMHVRRLDKISSDDKKQLLSKPRWKAVMKGNRGEPWAEWWKGPEFVVFGHDARSGLQELPFACGIDTGCVYGHRLTCIVYGPESPKGKLFSVPGLPNFTNETKGLPPPAAHVYEQYAEELEKQIFRPTPRATPPIASNGNKPTFLSAPPVPSPKTACTPGSGVVVGGPSTESCSFNSHMLEQATLLSLGNSGELRAIRTLMSLPMYETAWLSMLNRCTEDCVNTFWIPFVRGILNGLLKIQAGDAMDYADEVLQLVLEACDEIDVVRVKVSSQLQSLMAREEAGVFSVQKATSKFLRLVALMPTRVGESTVMGDAIVRGGVGRGDKTTEEGISVRKKD